jgi:hypothetical protein
MIRRFAYTLRPTRLRTVALALLGVIIGAACDNSSDPLAISEPTDPPEVAATADSSVTALGALEPSFATVSYTGLPFGPIGLWNSYTTVAWGPSPFTGTQNYTDATGIITQINAARTKKQRLILAMTGGPSTRYTTNGKFDMTKWKNKLNTFNTSAIRSAVAAGVSDGTIIGNQLIDEPETKRWGGNVSKAVIDQMATYAKQRFPSLPMGVNLGPPGYKWRTTEHFKVLDYVLYQYNHYITSGNITAFRDAVLSRARADGVTPMFSLNILDGGVQDRDGNYSCTSAGQAGKGTYRPNCRMTPTQVKNWGLAIGAAGCAMQMWRYDGTFMSKSANVDAVRSVASMLSSKARRSCRRP